MQILLAGKNLITREQLMKYLEANSLEGEIVECCTGLSALEIVSKCSIDIIISHLDLPVSGDGAKLLHYAKKFNPNIYTLAVGRGEDYVNLDPLLERSIDDFITAPFTPQELSIRLRKFFHTLHENKFHTVTPKKNRFSFLTLGKRMVSCFKPSKTDKSRDKEMKISMHSTTNKASDRIKRGESWGLKMLRYISRAGLFLTYLYILLTFLPLIKENSFFLIPVIILAALPVIIYVMHMACRPPGKREKKKKQRDSRISRRKKRNKNDWAFSSQFIMPVYRLRNRVY